MRSSKKFSQSLAKALLNTGAASMLIAADLSLNGAFAATSITMKTGNAVITATLDDRQTAQDFVKSLPLTLSMTRWGNREYYGKVREPLSDQGEKQNSFDHGEVAYWARGGSFAIFFNHQANPDISDLIVFGKITSDLKVFDAMDESLEMPIDLVTGVAK